MTAAPAAGLGGKVAEALEQASQNARQQLRRQHVKLPTQDWTGSPVRDPVV